MMLKKINKNILRNFIELKSPFTKLVLIFSMLIMFSCDSSDDKLILINQSNDTIYYSLTNKDSMVYPFYYRNNTLYINKLREILPKKKIKKHTSSKKWEDKINRAKDSTITIYFFSKKMIPLIYKDSMFLKQYYTKRYKLNVKDLEKMNWEVTYEK
jgi:hypothetical protein